MPSRLVPFAVAEGSPRKIRKGRLKAEPPPETELMKATTTPAKTRAG
jgi:hypothetical protein